MWVPYQGRSQPPLLLQTCHLVRAPEGPVCVWVGGALQGRGHSPILVLPLETLLGPPGSLTTMTASAGGYDKRLFLVIQQIWAPPPPEQSPPVPDLHQLPSLKGFLEDPGASAQPELL